MKYLWGVHHDPNLALLPINYSSIPKSQPCGMDLGMDPGCFIPTCMGKSQWYLGQQTAAVGGSRASHPGRQDMRRQQLSGFYDNQFRCHQRRGCRWRCLPGQGTGGWGRRFAMDPHAMEHPKSPQANIKGELGLTYTARSVWLISASELPSPANLRTWCDSSQQGWAGMEGTCSWCSSHWEDPVTFWDLVEPHSLSSVLAPAPGASSSHWDCGS